MFNLPLWFGLGVPKFSNIYELVSAGGVTIDGLLIKDGAIQPSSGQVQLIDAGTVSLPGLAFVGDTNTGLYRAAADTWAFSSGGALCLKGSTTLITAALPVGAPDGAVGAPAVTFSGDLDNGLYRIGTNNWAGSVGGAIGWELAASYFKAYASNTLVLTVGATSVTSAQPYLGPAGSISAVAFGATGDVNTGRFFPGADMVGDVAGGVEYVRIKHDASVPTLLDYSAPRVSYRSRAAMADADATLSDAQFRGGIVSMTPTAPRTLTTRTAAQMVAAFPGCQIGSSYELAVINLAAGQAIAVAGGAGVTVVGVANVDGTTLNLSGAGRFRLVFTNVTPSSEAADLCRVG